MSDVPIASPLQKSVMTRRRTGREASFDSKATALPSLMGGCQDLRPHLPPAQRSISLALP